MLIEMHMIQNFAPANLNRDDTGSPKQCDFGGHRRARISSQSFKRAMRLDFRRHLESDKELSVRTKNLGDLISRGLIEKGRDEEVSTKLVNSLLKEAKVAGKDGKTESILLVGVREHRSLTTLINDNWGELVEDEKVKKPDGNLIKSIKETLDGGGAVDLALFGRMLASLPEKSVDAASQVAHAISTNAVNMEFDYFTAVDDLTPKEEAGAAHIGSVGFNSSCFYRYLNLDVDQLKDNFRGESTDIIPAIRAFLKSSVAAIPSGKQNSFAAHSPPSLVHIVIRDGPPQSLVNAFVKPVRTHRTSDLVQDSIVRHSNHWNDVNEVYGSGEVVYSGWTALGTDSTDGMMEGHHSSFSELIESVLSEVQS